MAFEPLERNLIARSARGYLGYYGEELTLPEIAQQIGRRYGVLTPSDYQIILSTVVQQRDVLRYGGELNDPTLANTATDPRRADWTLVENAERFGFWAEVTALNEVTGDQASRLILIPSNATLTPDQIRNEALQRYQRDPTDQGRYPTAGGVQQELTYEVRIVSAGRNPL